MFGWLAPRSRGCIAASVALACWLGLAGAAWADTITVTRVDDPAGAGACPDDCSLRQAIDFAAAGDTILLGGTVAVPNVYVLTQGNSLLVNKALTITGSNPLATRIDGQLNRNGQGLADRILKVTSGDVAITELTFTRGYDERDENFQSCSPCTAINANGGGALFNQGANVTLDRVVFESNSAPVGGAIGMTGGTLTLADVDFRANSGSFGAGLFVRAGNAAGTRTTFRDGSGSRGGGVFLFGGFLSLTNSTIVGNGSPSNVGGGIVNRAGNLGLLNVTIHENLRGGLRTHQGANTTVQNSILGTGFSDVNNGACSTSGQPDSTVGSPTASPVTNDLGNNLAADGTCGLTDPGSQSGVDPRLAPIGDNAGPTLTAALLAGSPALDAGNPAACPNIDQRGTVRPQGALCDIGAFEANRFGLPSVTTEAPAEVGSTTATLVATVNLAGEAGAYSFDYGTAPTALDESSGLATAGEIVAPEARSLTLHGLLPGTTYYARAAATNATGTAFGDPVTFTTGAAAPELYDVRVLSVTDTTAQIAFTIDPQGADTTDRVLYEGAAGGGSTAPVSVGATPGPQSRTVTLSNLAPGTWYTYEVVATNSEGTVDSGGSQFATAPRLTGTAGSPTTLTHSGNFWLCPDSASIDWGDGTPADESGTIECTPDAHDAFDYELTAAHAYAAAGRFHIQITYSTGENADVWAQIAAPGPPAPTPSPVPVAQPTPTPSPAPTPSPTPTPVFHKSVAVEPAGGTVLVKVKGSKRFVRLQAGQAIPLGSQVDVTKGRITLTSIPKPGGKPETATFYAGIFTVTQPGSITQLALSGPLPTCKARASAGRKKVKVRRLWGDGKGSFRTKGRYAAATVRGTIWLVEDTCAGTRVKVKRGSVSVRDQVRRKTVTVRAPKSYLARSRRG